MDYDKIPEPPCAPPIWRLIMLLLLMGASPAVAAIDSRVDLSQQREQEAATLLAGDPVAALGKLREAWELQRAIDRESNDAARNLAREIRLEHETAQLAASLEGAELATQVEQSLAAAKQAEKPEEALRSYQQAAALQRRINLEHPRSRYVSMERLDEIETLRQSAAAVPVVSEVLRLDMEIAAHLRGREIYQAVTKAGEALACIERIEASCPKVKHDERMRLKLTFLQLRAPALMTLQDEAFDALCPMAREPERAVSRTRVTQRWYAHVMNAASASDGDQPVETLTPADAEEFCRRLGWILGVSVRLWSGEERSTPVLPQPGFRVVAEMNLLKSAR